MAKELLQDSSLVNIPDKNGYTPLDVAIERKSKSLTTYLLDRGANPNAMEYLEISPMMLACRCASVEIVTLLHQYGANLELVDPYGWTALFHAVDAKRYQIVECLLRLGADFMVTYPASNSEDSSVLTVLDLAQGTGNKKIIQILQRQMIGT